MNEQSRHRARRIATVLLVLAALGASAFLISTHRANRHRFPGSLTHPEPAGGRRWATGHSLLPLRGGAPLFFDGKDPDRSKPNYGSWEGTLARRFPDRRLLALHPQVWSSSTGSAPLARELTADLDIAIAAIARRDGSPEFIVAIGYGEVSQGRHGQVPLGYELISIDDVPAGHVPVVAHIYRELRDRSFLDVCLGNPATSVHPCIECLPTDVAAWLRGEASARPSRPSLPVFSPSLPVIELGDDDAHPLGG